MSRRTLLDDADESFDATGGGQNSDAPAATEGDRQRCLCSPCGRGTSDLRVRHFPLGRLRRSYHHPLQTAFPRQWLVSALVGLLITVRYRGGRTVVLKVRVSPDLIAGDVDEGYGKVADVFRRNMTIGQEVGPPKVISLSRNYSRATESSSQSRRVRSSCATSHRFGRLRIVSSLGSQFHPVHRAACIFGWEIKSRSLVPQGQDR